MNDSIKLLVLRCPTCDTPYVLRWTLSLTTGEAEYLYQRDCKHKSSLAGLAIAAEDAETAELSGGAVR